MTIIWKNYLSGVDVTIHALLTEDKNYIFMMTWDRKAICFDPLFSENVFNFLEQHNIELAAIFITHDHKKHKGALHEILKKHDVNVLGPDGALNVKQNVMSEDELIFGPFLIKVLSLPGVSPSHVGYYFSEKHLLFSGDAISAGGCGKVGEGSVEQLYNSLKLICHLPQDTELFFIHESTLRNLQFACSLDPQNPKIPERIEKETFKQSQGIPTVPCKLSEETLINPFLRCKNLNIRENLHIHEATELDVFERIYRMREEYEHPKQI